MGLGPDTTRQRIGVVGGGQLAWMMGPAAETLGLTLVVQTPCITDPAVAIAADTVLAAVADAEGTARLAQRCDVITFENEFIDPVALAPIAATCPMYPQLDILQMVLDKADQRACFADLGLPNPRFAVLNGEVDIPQLADHAQAIGFPLVLKTRRLGYDGYGTAVVQTLTQLQQTWAETDHAPVLLEEFIPFEKELAVMVARNLQGRVAIYPTVETQQVNQICRRVLAPARISPTLVDQVHCIAQTLVDKLGLVGILGLELFLTPDQRVLINEIAPRTHNSGHYSLDACQTSQFEQQLRAVSGMNLGPVALTCPQAVMINLLGTDVSEAEVQHRCQQLAQFPDAHLYWYGKNEMRPGRKMGHVTVCLPAEADPERAIADVERIWYGEA